MYPYKRDNTVEIQPLQKQQVIFVTEKKMYKVFAAHLQYIYS